MRVPWMCLGLLLGLLGPGSARADVQCDGVDDRLTSGLATSVFVTPLTFTLSVRVLTTGAAAEAGSYCYNAAPVIGDADGFYALGRLGPAGDACAILYDDVDVPSTLSAPLAAGWHTVSLRSVGGTLTLWVDGVPTAPLSHTGLAAAAGLLVGCGNDHNSSPDRITDLRIYAFALSDAELATLGRSRLRRPTRATPSGAWPLDDCPVGSSGDTEPFRDRSGQNRHLTGTLGANLGGLTCHGSAALSRPMPIQ